MLGSFESVFLAFVYKMCRLEVSTQLHVAITEEK